jgi:hypothetical protein
MLTRSQTNTREKNKAAGIAEFHFIHKAGEQLLNAASTYKNAWGEEFTITRFRYYISNIEFITKEGKTIKPGGENYFLLDEEDEFSKNFSTTIPAGTYNAISFLVGVDSLCNVSGAQTGALDPLNGMFWTWKSGYIMAKMEGRSPASSLPGNLFEYHIGGYKGKENVVKKIILDFPGGEKTFLQNKITVIEISADALEWFQDPEKLSISSHPSCTTPGALARKFADNYADMFSISSINDE